MKTKHNKINMFLNVPKYDGAGVYVFVDDESKMQYIGSSININKRLCMHNQWANSGKEPRKLQEAINRGARFHVYILEKVPPYKTFYDLRKLESDYIKSALSQGKQLYNTIIQYEDDLKPDMSNNGNFHLFRPVRPDLIIYDDVDNELLKKIYDEEYLQDNSYVIHCGVTRHTYDAIASIAKLNNKNTSQFLHDLILNEIIKNVKNCKIV